MTKRKKKEENKKEEKEKIDEIFEVEKTKNEKDLEKNNKEKIIKVHKEIEKEEEEPSKKEIQKENKILRNAIIILVLFALGFLGIYLFIHYSNNFEYEDMKWNIIKEGHVIFYHTSFPILLKGEKTNYNVYLRNDPRKLEKIPFNGDLSLREVMVINNTENFICDGKGGAAMLNLQQIFETYGTDLIKDTEATCDSQGRYMFVKIQKGNETSIEQTGMSCYNINVKDCEIVKATERLIIETLLRYKVIT